MTGKLPVKVESPIDWRTMRADALERQVVDIQNWLAHTDTILEQAEHQRQEQVATVLLTTAGYVKSWRNELVDQARELRMTDPKEPPCRAY